MIDLVFREPLSADWPALLGVAERSLAEFPAAPGQAHWMHNRRSFALPDGVQQHFVATSDDRIVGYGCVERRNDAADGWYRLFVVVEPAARAMVGTMLLAKLRECLLELGARCAWLMEYEADARFISYLEQFGFVISKNLLIDGTPAVQLTIDAPFQSLEPRE